MSLNHRHGLNANKNFGSIKAMAAILPNARLHYWRNDWEKGVSVLEGGRLICYIIKWMNKILRQNSKLKMQVLSKPLFNLFVLVHFHEVKLRVFSCCCKEFVKMESCALGQTS